ncbi:nucleotide exchange factor Fes1-domain-containing protein [Boeremia exigua]|uniref:nucleotide exchange factor Fes1-domain-containing protein n=1 Tax=Boeremia exigua TaxID=749465 RepID=UPI001E8EC7E9|nr:nucleotide exchange factor Fes1-domain-containing protein [Boeremia exigua]KAH6642353.1 nucleotide exchange factor Fes1-domain-containing protein [Boeremia exigua]
MADPNLNTLLKWGVENSNVSEGAEAPKTQLNSEALAALFGGNIKSDAQMMKDNMEVIKRDECELEDRITAFDNFEQLIENLDNANNLESLNLWIPLIAQLENKEAELRRYAAWCIGTAVQNNIKTQEKLLVLGAIPTLVRMSTGSDERKVKKKAITALSSSVRNFQPALDDALSHVPADFKPTGKLDANDMESVDTLINKLRESL